MATAPALLVLGGRLLIIPRFRVFVIYSLLLLLDDLVNASLSALCKPLRSRWRRLCSASARLLNRVGLPSFSKPNRFSQLPGLSLS